MKAYSPARVVAVVAVVVGEAAVVVAVVVGEAAVVAVARDQAEVAHEVVAVRGLLLRRDPAVVVRDHLPERVPQRVPGPVPAHGQARALGRVPALDPRPEHARVARPARSPAALAAPVGPRLALGREAAQAV